MNKERNDIQNNQRQNDAQNIANNNTVQGQHTLQSKEPHQVDQQEGNMDNGELGGNFEGTDDSQ